MGKKDEKEVLNREIAERIRETRGRDTRLRVQELTGLHPNTLANYEAGRMPDSGFVIKFCEAYGINENWLLGGRGPRERDQTALSEPAHIFRWPAGEMPATDWKCGPPIAEAEANTDGSVLIPVYALGRAGIALYSLRFVSGWIADAGVDPLCAELLIAAGDRMAPTIVDGDMLLIARAYEAAVDGIYVMQRGGVRMLHRVQHQVDGAAVLRADNKAYEDERVSADDLAQLMGAGGRVRMIFRRV